MGYLNNTIIKWFVFHRSMYSIQMSIAVTTYQLIWQFTTETEDLANQHSL